MIVKWWLVATRTLWVCVHLSHYTGLCVCVCVHLSHYACLCVYACLYSCHVHISITKSNHILSFLQRSQQDYIPTSPSYLWLVCISTQSTHSYTLMMHVTLSPVLPLSSPSITRVSRLWWPRKLWIYPHSLAPRSSAATATSAPFSKFSDGFNYLPLISRPRQASSSQVFNNSLLPAVADDFGSLLSASDCTCRRIATSRRGMGNGEKEREERSD